MARRKIGTITEVKVDFSNYSYLLNGISGIGKTTLVTEIGQKLFGVDGFLLLSIGQEPTPGHLKVLSERAKDWEDLEEIIDTIVEYKKEDYPNLKMVAIDTVDEVFRLAEAQVVKMYNESVDNPIKMVKSIKQSYGGYQAGENKVVDLVVETLFKLRDENICPFFIGHTKKKNAKDIATDIEYEVLTSNLEAKYYNAIKDKVNVVGCAYVEREMNDIETVKDAFTKKNKQVGRISSEQRVVVFRDEEYATDVKSHLEFIAPKCKFETDVFVDTIMDAIQKQANKRNGVISPQKKEIIKTPVEDIKEETIEDILLDQEPEKQMDELIVDEQKNEELKSKIQKAITTEKDKEKAKKIKEILASYDCKALDVTKPTKMFEEILNIFE